MSEGIVRPVFGPAFFIHWKAHPIEREPREHWYGELSVLFVRSRVTIMSPHAPGRNGYYPQGIVFPFGYSGHELDLKVLSPYQSQRGLGEMVVLNGIRSNGVRCPAMRLSGLKKSEVYITREARATSLALDRLIYEVAIAKPDTLKGRLTYVLPRVGVDEEDVTQVRQAIINLLLLTS